MNMNVKLYWCKVNNLLGSSSLLNTQVRVVMIFSFNSKKDNNYEVFTKNL